MNKSDAIKIFEELLKILNLDVKQLSEILDVSKPALYNILDSEKKTLISKNIASKIESKFPYINKDYLLTGNGSILLNSNITEFEKETFALSFQNLSKAVLVSSEANLNNSEGFKDCSKALLLSSEAFDRMTRILEKVVDNFIDKKSNSIEK